ncbi:MAG: pitrilysin family protein [Patescibacteria group bacterium]|jgi:predicted Zn-dependent peptidase
MYKKTSLKSGLRFIHVPVKDIDTATFLVLFGVGSKYETDKIAGLSHFLEHMFFKGTTKRPDSMAISEYLDEVGGEYNAFTSKEYTGYYAKVASKHIERGVDFVSDILLHSKFDASELEKERGVIIEEMNMYRDMPANYVSELFEKLLYGNTPAGELIVGHKESILGVKRDDFVNYFKSHYLIKNAVVCMAGNIDEKESMDLAEKYLGEFIDGKKVDKEKVIEKQEKSEILVFNKKTDQTHLCLGVRSFDMFSEKRYPLLLLSVILGGGMSSRLFSEIREKRGLAYYVRANSEEYTDSGYMVVQAGVKNENADDAIKVCIDEFKKIKDVKVSEKELKKAKEFIKGRTLIGLESSDEKAMFFSMQEVLKNKIETIEEKFKKIDAVTVEDVQKIAQEIFVNEKLNLSIIGPIENKDEYLKLLSL